MWYANNVTESIVVVSVDLTHNKYSVWAFLKTKLLTKYTKKHTVTNIFVFFVFSDIDLPFKYNFSVMVWNFFAASHGKGAVDGIGGTTKRLVWTAVKLERL